MNKKPKVLLIQEYIPHYRMPIFNDLAEQVDLCVVYSKGTLPPGAKFMTKYIPTRTIPINLLFKKTGRTYSTISYYRLAQDFDVVICIAYYKWIDMTMMEYLPHKYKLIYWGIGVSASYGELYDTNQSFAKQTCRHARNVDAMLFYSDYPVRKYVSMGVPPQKLFVANNTVEVSSLTYTPRNRNNFLFIGTLYKEKQVDVLIEAYREAQSKNDNIFPLTIIGDGSERSRLESMVKSYKLSNNITFVGNITNEQILKSYFSNSILCISPNQAGLSVLKSMGYGVPYVTHKDAITGGEIFNIHNGLDGILMNDFSELENILIECSCNPEKYLSMGKAAYDFYHKNRMPRIMVKGFIDAIKYVLQ